MHAEEGVDDVPDFTLEISAAPAGGMGRSNGPTSANASSGRWEKEHSLLIFSRPSPNSGRPCWYRSQSASAGISFFFLPIPDDVVICATMVAGSAEFLPGLTRG